MSYPSELSFREGLAPRLHSLSAVGEHPDDDSIAHDGLVVIDVRGAGLDRSSSG